MNGNIHKDVPLHNDARPSLWHAFTLIELLVVIGVLTFLASMIFPAANIAHRNSIRKRAYAEMEQISTAIEMYREKLGSYPPDNPANAAINPLYFELLGTTLSNGAYVTIDGSARINQSALGAGPPTGFGSGFSGFMNTSAGQDGDSKVGARNFLRGLRTSQIGELSSGVKILIGPVPWPASAGASPTPNATLSPWCYNSSSPVHNPKSFDLWVDLVIGGRTNRICNWSDRTLVL